MGSPGGRKPGGRKPGGRAPRRRGLPSQAATGRLWRLCPASGGPACRNPIGAPRLHPSRREGGNEMKELDSLRVAILAADGFEQVELTDPKEALEKAGAQ